MGMGMRFVAIGKMELESGDGFLAINPWNHSMQSFNAIIQSFNAIIAIIQSNH